MQKRTILLSAIVAIVIAFATAPSVVALSAHPHTHSYTGAHVTATSANFVIKDGNPPPSHIHLAADFVIDAMCLDAIPFIQTIPLLPPTLVYDGDPETGVGGSCFPFATVYGDDTDQTLDVHVFEEETRAPVFWLTCVDMNGDGLCSSVVGGDLLNFCTTGTGPIGSVSITNGGGPCSIYTDGSAAIPAIQVLMFGAIEVNHEDGATVNPAVHGSISLR